MAIDAIDPKETSLSRLRVECRMVMKAGNAFAEWLKTMPPHSKYFQFLTDAVEKVGSEPSSRNN